METVVLRFYTPGLPAFRLRPGEEGLSVFVPELVEPPLTEAEVFDDLRSGSRVARVAVGRIEAQGLVLVGMPGAATLSARLRVSHAEIRPGPQMTRNRFKRALKELE